MSGAAVGDLRSRLSEQQQLALLPEDPDAAEAAVETARGPGRPAGAVNRATRQMREYILRNFTDPATGLASSGLCVDLMRSLEKAGAIASAIGCKKIEALEFMRRCSEALLPYTHSKMPQAVQITGKVASLNIGLGVACGRVSGDELAQLLDEFAGAAVLELEDLTELENDEQSKT